ncbi:MAG: diguanylate cyclase [Myxococcales bacterium]|nr:diguanylate cyclase [Myxococcales bacterium]
MQEILSRLINIGVPKEMNPEQAKYIQMANLSSLVMIPVMLPFLVLCLLNGWRLLFLEMCLFNGLILLTTALNRRGRHEAANIFYGILVNAHLVITTVALGSDTLMPLLILCGIGGAITMIPRGDIKPVIMAFAMVIASYAAALVLVGAYGPFYQLTTHQLHILRGFVAVGLFIAISVNAAIGRLGASITEDRLRAEQQRSADLLSRLQEEDRRKTEFFQNVSHELRTPLTLILGPLEGLLADDDAALGESHRRRLEMMMRNARRLLRLINQLLDLSKIDAGKVGLSPRSGNLSAFVEDLTRSFAAYAEQKGIALAVRDSGDGVTADFDPEIIEKVVSNLLSNACKFTPAGGRVEVSVTAPPGHREVGIAVRDTGIGIAPADLATIFDRFHQVDGSTTRSHEGTGIGLSLVQELVRLHGGRIAVRSEPGRGTVFDIFLPREQTAPPIPAAEAFGFAYAELESNGLESPPLEAAAAETPPGKQPVILVVEDNPDMREYLCKGIKTRYRVIAAVNGEDGLEKARLHQPQLIVSDVMMPVMNGHVLCRALQADERLKTIPVILLTAKTSREAVLESLESGAIDCLTKPFSFDVLLVKIRGILQRKAEHEHLALRDRLTGLLNRGAWTQAVGHEMEKLARYGGVLSLAFLDVDNFKHVNDSHGHQTGDQVLIELATTLVGELRSVDLLGRYGGEEFVLCFPESSGANAVRLMQRILQVFRAKPIGALGLQCSFSAGVVEIGPDKVLSLDEYLARADAAMYQAKREGKGRVLLWRPE